MSESIFVTKKTKTRPSLMSCYLASSTHTCIKHRTNECITRATTQTNYSHVPPHQRTHRHMSLHTCDYRTSHHTCELMHYRHAYPCHVCNNNTYHSLIHIIHHRVHAHNSYTCTPPCVKWNLIITQGKVIAWVTVREYTKQWCGQYSDFYRKLDPSSNCTINNSDDA